MIAPITDVTVICFTGLFSHQTRIPHGQKLSQLLGPWHPAAQMLKTSDGASQDQL